MKTCPYCKIDFDAAPWARGTRNVVCFNCRYYADAIADQNAQREEMILFKTYKMIPWGWRLSDDWRTDPQYFK